MALVYNGRIMRSCPALSSNVRPMLQRAGSIRRSVRRRCDPWSRRAAMGRRRPKLCAEDRGAEPGSPLMATSSWSSEVTGTASAHVRVEDGAETSDTRGWDSLTRPMTATYPAAVIGFFLETEGSLVDAG